MESTEPSVNRHPLPPDTREMSLNMEIARRAYELWEKYSRPTGRDVIIWLEAERQLLGVDAAVSRQGDGTVAAAPLGDSLYASRTDSGRETPVPPPVRA